MDKEIPGGVECLKDNPGASRKVSKVSKTVEATIQKIINTDARYTIHELAKATGIAIF